MDYRTLLSQYESELKSLELRRVELEASIKSLLNDLGIEDTDLSKVSEILSVTQSQYESELKSLEAEIEALISEYNLGR